MSCKCCASPRYRRPPTNPGKSSTSSLRCPCLKERCKGSDPIQGHFLSPAPLPQPISCSPPPPEPQLSPRGPPPLPELRVLPTGSIGVRENQRVELLGVAAIPLDAGGAVLHLQRRQRQREQPAAPRTAARRDQPRSILNVQGRSAPTAAAKAFKARRPPPPARAGRGRCSPGGAAPPFCGSLRGAGAPPPHTHTPPGGLPRSPGWASAPCPARRSPPSRT